MKIQTCGVSTALNYGTISTLSVSPANSDVVWAGTDDGNVWVTANAMQIGSTLELLLLSYALINRIDKLFLEKYILSLILHKLYQLLLQLLVSQLANQFVPLPLQ